ncbi:MAG: superoxide dismutase, partial [Acidocella sp.]|nr:superoxide dismutase [Acidocella sp.]
KHHQAYVTALNGFVAADAALQGKSLDEIVMATAATPGPVFNNAGQHWNHIVFWECMSPNGGHIPPKLQAKIDSDLGGTAAFKDAFK